MYLLLSTAAPTTPREVPSLMAATVQGTEGNLRLWGQWGPGEKKVPVSGDCQTPVQVLPEALGLGLELDLSSPVLGTAV